MSLSVVLIDGSVLEGGGQILRNSVALSALLRKPVSIHKIRNNREPPGLRNQHSVGIQLVSDICSGRLTGADHGSTEVHFVPGRIVLPCNMTADAITAGSTNLLLQTALPTLLFAPDRLGSHAATEGSSSTDASPSNLILRGGTNASAAPQADYAQHILLPFLKRHFGVAESLIITLKRRGYFPKGGGEIHVSIPSRTAPLRPIQLLERGKLLRIGGLAHLSLLPNHLGRDMIEGAMTRLAKGGILPVPYEALHTPAEDASGVTHVPIHIDMKREPNEISRGGGCGIVLWAESECGSIIGGSALGKKGLSSYLVGETAAEELLKGLESGGCVDEYLQDQIIIFMALAEGTSSVRTGPLSLHTKTAIWVAEQLTDARFEVIEEDSKSSCVIHCKGIGYTAPTSTDLDIDTLQTASDIQ